MTRDFSDGDVLRFWASIRRTHFCWLWIGGYRGASPIFFSHNPSREHAARRTCAELTGWTVGKRRLTNTCGNWQCVNPAHSTWKGKGAVQTVEPPVQAEYNDPQRNSFSLSLDGDNFLAALAPLRHGKPVHLVMDDPKFAAMKKYVGTKAKKLVFLVPGSMIGIDPSGVLVSILESGSCVVWPKRPPKVANLVLAGMPAKLANVLMQKLHRIFQE